MPVTPPASSSGGGGTVIFQDEGSAVGTATILNFVGAGVEATHSGGTVTATISGGTAGALTDHTHEATGSGATGGGGTVNPTSFSPTGLIAFASSIDSTVNADQNDYLPTGFHTSFALRFTSFTANRTVTGLDAGATGEMHWMVNNTSFSLLLPNESASSVAANRFRCPNGGTVTVRTSGSVLVGYFAGRWTVLDI